MTTQIPSPFRFPAIWDSVSFGGGAFTWSGKIEFRGAARSYNWQVKEPPGVQGEVYTYRGLRTKPFRMRLEVWTDAQWQLLPGLLAFFDYDNAGKPNPNGSANPFDIYHPALSALNISQVLCLDVEAPEVDQERTGAVWWTFVLREYRPAPTVNVTNTPTAVQTPIVVLNAQGGSLGQKITTEDTAVQNEGQNLPATLP